MAFTSTITQITVIGSQKKATGTFASAGGSVGGDIDTGLRLCKEIFLTTKAAAITTGANVVNETLPVAGSAVTIVTDANVVGTWTAFGK